MSKKISDNYSNILLVNKQAKTIDNLETLISQYESGASSLSQEKPVDNNGAVICSTAL